MRGMLADCRHALRIYARTPGASLFAVAGFAVAMAAVASFVSLYVDLILRPHPGFENSGYIVTYARTDGRYSSGLPIELIEQISENSATLEAAAGVMPAYFMVGIDREQVLAELVTEDFFPGVRPTLAMGRGFSEEEHTVDGAPVVVISHRYWQESLGGREDILGTRLQVRGRPQFNRQAQEADEELPDQFQIIGVMGSDFTGTAPPALKRETDIWIPFKPGLALLRSASANSQIDIALLSSVTLQGIGRRARGVSSTAIAIELKDRFSRDLPQLYADSTTRYDVLDGLVYNTNVQRNTQRQLQLFLGASILLGIVAAANVSLFILARAPGRRRELGIRMAVGAPLKRLARQLASEAALLVFVAAALGLVISVWFAEYLRGLTFLQSAEWRDVTLLDWRVIALIGAFVAIMTLLVSLAPILGLGKLGIAGSSRQISARASVAQRLAGAAQITVAGALGGAAVAFSWYLGSMLLAHPGFDTRNLHAASYRIVLSVGESGNVLGDSLADQRRRKDAILSLPGVIGVSLNGMVPGMQAMWRGIMLQHPDDPAQRIELRRVPIDGEYVEMLGIRLLHGRSPTDTDIGAGLVNQRLAHALFGRDNVVGESFPISENSEERIDIVGVVEDLSYEHPAADIVPMAFVTSGLNSTRGVALIESAMTPAELELQLRGLIDDGSLDLSLVEIEMLRSLRWGLVATDRARGFLTIGAAGLVVLLAAVGFYGTQRYLVIAGRREYAIRASMGAGPRALGWLVMLRGLLLGLPGLALSLPLAFIVVAWLRDDYVSRETSPFAVTVAVALGLVLLLIAASAGPALQARRTQPAPLLRQD